MKNKKQRGLRARRAAGRSRRAGFTLTELMVVIVIIGVLATAGFMTFQFVIGGAKNAKAVSAIEQMNKAISSYNLTKGEYPADLEEAAAFTKENFPKEDPWGRAWEYHADEDGYSLASKGEDEADEADDIWFDTEYGRIFEPGQSPDDQ